jgi:uncharacterized protein Yka (UPF0111/DUF47 family)
MTAKVQIVEQLGEAQVLLPELLAAALAANDRAKVRMTLLQEAVAHAQMPASPAHTLEEERRAAGLDHPVFASTVKDARLLDAGRFAVPGAKMLLLGLYGDIEALIAPVRVADARKGEEFAKRLAALRSALPEAEDDVLTGSAVAGITSARLGGADSAHLLIMDLHKSLNKLGAEAAVETVDGARVHGHGPLEKRQVEAFMRGLNSTRGLAFGHPGLGTTAARSGSRLIIQNDIGTTDAHVLVIHAERLAVSITYTDIHRRRTQFFMHLFDGYDVEWSGLSEKRAQNLGKNGQFLLLTGRFQAKEAAHLEDFLQFLGSRLVFMIDWNKARKALRNFVDDDTAIAVLRWAASHNYGHRAFLELGGAELIYEAVRSGGGHVPYGRRLDEALGVNEAAEFLKHTLRVASEGILAGRSVRLVKDEVQARFLSQFESMEASLLTVIGRHLGLSRMMAGLILDAIRNAPDATGRTALAAQARRLEHKADALTVEARAIATRLAAASGVSIKAVANSVEDANDALEEAAFLLSLAPDGGREGTRVQPLEALAGIAVESLAQMIRAVEAAHALPEGLQADVTDALRAIDAVMHAERQADEALRTAMAAFISQESEARLLVLKMETAHRLETATDFLAHAAFALRDRVLGELPV